MDFFAKNLRFYFKKVKPEVSLMAMAAAMLAVTAALYGLSCFFVPDHAPDCQRHNTCDDQANDDCSQHICSSILACGFVQSAPLTFEKSFLLI
jgi:hypothetical protein